MIKIRNTVLAKNIIYCRSLFSRIKGLMLKRNLDVNTSYILVNKKDSIEESSIHTFFMLFKIDILWVNSENIIVDKREDVKPFTMNSIELLYEKTGGFPRDVIKLCNDVVERALENNISLIDSDFISEEKAIQRTSINTVAEMPKRQKDIIHILSKYGELTPTEVASKIDLKGYGNKNNAMRSVNNLLRRLMSNKLVTRKKHGKAYKYALASKIQTVLVKA